MNLKSRLAITFDLRSIRFKLWAYFIAFAFLLIFGIWVMQIFFLNNYYEAMKISETNKIADDIKTHFYAKPSVSDLITTIDEISYRNDVFIMVENYSQSMSISQKYQGHGPSHSYQEETDKLKERLDPTVTEPVSIIINTNKRSRSLGYATYLSLAKKSDGEIDKENTYILYIFSPLFPVESTVSILRLQLMYITLISAIVALCIAMYLSARISRPIKNINRSAAEMGRGNYGVKFTDGSYTELKELANTLTNASIELEKTSLYQKDLIANVSHDLKTPLTMIKSYAEMIRDLSGDNLEKRNAHLHVIIDEADRLNSLVGDMLSLSKMQSRSVELNKNYFDICQTARNLFSSYRLLSEQEGYNFTFDCSHSAIVYGDEAKIKQVMSNLINNAVKYCGSDKEILISVKANGKKVVVKVSDHGEGIAPDEISHVWERYYKSSTHHVRPTEGSGLGLSIVKEIMTLHKCQYGVESKVGKGSTFWFEMEEVKNKNR